MVKLLKFTQPTAPTETWVSKAKRKTQHVGGLFYGAFITLVSYSWRYSKCEASYG
jgi:hypothetical protein